MDAAQVMPPRTYFWRRLLALGIDALLVGTIVGVIGVGLSLLTDGAIRAADDTLSKTTCQNVDRKDTGIELPADFSVTRASKCVRQIFGHEYDWFVVVEERKQQGKLYFEWNILVPLDRSGQVVRAIYLDVFVPLLLIAYIFAQEARRRQTLGKRVTGLHIQSRNAAPVSMMQTRKRLARFAGLVPVALLYLFTLYGRYGSDYEIVFTLPRLSVVILGLSAVVFVATLADFLIASLRRKLPFYDRWAGTEVIPKTSPATA
jgi:uncharacterized RDD family membrane protein YckC